MSALDELEAAWTEARDNADFRAELDAPSSRLRGSSHTALPGRAALRARRASRLPEARGPGAHRRPQDQQRGGPGPARAADGQAADHRRDWRRAARGGERNGLCPARPWSASVYMGTEDMRRQAPNVERMRLLGAEVAPVEAGARTLKEAVSAAIRDWVTNVGSTHYIIGSAVGPAPYPALVRDLQRVIGDEARAQALEAEGGLPARVLACVGGGSNAIGTFTAFLDDPVELIGIEAGERDSRAGTELRWSPDAPGSFTAHAHRFSPTPRGRSSRRTPSQRASTIRASGPSTHGCATPGAPATRLSPTTTLSGRSGSSPASRASSRRWSPPT